MRVGQKLEQLRAGELGAALILDVPGDDRQATLGRECPELIASAGRILLISGRPEVGSNVAHAISLGLVRMVHVMAVHFELPGGPFEPAQSWFARGVPKTNH